MIQILSFLILLVVNFILYVYPTYAIVDPLQTSNNKFGIHIISPTPQEASEAANLVNSSGGDWGYVTILIESKDRDVNKWQNFFNELRRRHLIPIVRLATKPINSHWERPYEKEYEAWADFLDRLVWPTKNRYVTIYNEPNHGKEWGEVANPTSYAKVLSATVDVLKAKSDDFFVMNAGFDASTPHQPPNYFDEELFLKQMEKEVPGIFNKLDGWVSHSYPNPGFIGSPNGTGRGSIKTWSWELEILKSLGLKKDLPIFITETGWRHAEGVKLDSSLPTSEKVGAYFEQAFQETFSDPKIVTVTPFLLNYQTEPFDHFSFKKVTGEKQNTNILGVAYPDYYPQYEAVASITKPKGAPLQENRAQLVKGEVYRSIVAGEIYNISITLKNIGQSIWNGSTSLTTSEQVKFIPIKGGTELGIEPVPITDDVKVEPGQEYTFHIKLKAPQSGTYQVALNLVDGERVFDNPPIEFTTTVKAPVLLKIHAGLSWKKDPSGVYFLKITGPVGDIVKTVEIGLNGQSQDLEAKYLLPDYTFEFFLEKPFYKPKVVKKSLTSGLNNLDFGVLEPDFLRALTNPKELWKLLPFSN